ncbi:hypothetical protein [Inhella sp.]|uniref:hypothetical protein n=1 Tax=Inhella sp. TaxID=1921806 RepID=UPI0035B156EA
MLKGLTHWFSTKQDTSTAWSSEPELLAMDTEFSQFREGELLSIGLVGVGPGIAPLEPGCLPSQSLDARHAFYGEVHDAVLWQRSSDFCRQIVLPQFGRVPAARCSSLRELGGRLGDWLLARHRPLMLCYDYKLDWRFFEQALVVAGRWDALKPKLMALDIADATTSEACRQAAAETMQAFAGGPLSQHHALVDAMALAAQWRQASEPVRLSLTAQFIPSQDSEATRLARQ